MGYVYYPMQIAYGVAGTYNVNNLTTIENTILPIITGTPETGRYNFSSFGAMMVDTVGSGYYILDGVGRIPSTDVSTGRLWFPNLDGLFPGTNAYMTENPYFSDTYRLYFIIPKLHRVFTTTSTTQNPSIYRLNSDGTMTFISSSSAWNFIPSIVSGRLYWFTCLSGELSALKTADNWSKEYNMGFNSSNPADTTLMSIDNGRSLSQSVLTAIFSDAEAPDIPPDTEDPYGPGGDSEEGGGDGDFTDDTEDIDIPEEPSLSASDTKFITLYNPTKTQLDNLANYMWSAGFDLDTFKKLFADPMDCILGLSIVPVNVPAGSTRAVTVGNISTGVSMTVAAKQYVTVDCGTLNVKEYWGAYLDYDPYTKAEIYLPYIGTHAIAVDDIMKKSVKVVYRVDILSGACTAYVKCGGSVLYEFIGQCASSIPITGNDWTNVINGVLTIAGSIGTMVATGGATAPMAVGTIASACTNSLKPNVEKSGSMSGTGGLMGVQKPYLILTRPRQAKPKNQNKYIGYPSFITSKVDDLSGFTIFESIRLEDIPGTQQELEELKNLLESGVIL